MDRRDANVGRYASNGHRRGRLKVFFGYAPGVGKTHTMLEAARVAKRAGKDVVIGHADLHGRAETEFLLSDQEMLIAASQLQTGVASQEFDLDAALDRCPELILIDDLAHTNASTSRNRKRWQDVEELLNAGIDVWTTMNVQHIESLREAVERITGVPVLETIPDRVFEEASEIELVDLPPDELLTRLREGKVHVPEQMAPDSQELFRKPHLIAFRELAMRCVADRVRGDVQRPRPEHLPGQQWTTTERLLVYLGTGTASVKLIRAAQRMASAMRAEWVVVYSEASQRKLDKGSRESLARHLRLAEQLGAETVALTGGDVVEEIISYAASRNVTRIVIGKESRGRGLRFWQRSPADRLIAQSGDIDVYVIRSAEENLPSAPFGFVRTRDVRNYGKAVGLLALATGVATLFDRVGLTDATLVMTYLLAVVIAAVRLGRGPAIFSSIAGVLLFNFFFTAPRLTFVVDNPEYIYTFSVMLAITLVVSALTARIRKQIELSRDRERRTEVLYRVSHRLAGVPGELQLVQAAQEELVSIFSGEIVFFLPRDGSLRAVSRHDAGFTGRKSEQEAAKWVFEHRQMAGWGTDAIPDAQALYIPLTTPDSTVGVLAWCPEDSEQLLNFERRQLLKAIAAQIALALERDRLAQEAQHILAQAEAENLRSSLLSAVSHDLRTPLTSIAGTASTLIEEELDANTRRKLAGTIYEEADRLNQLLENLLQLTRLESGSLQIRKEWQPIDEVIGSSLRRQERILQGREIHLNMPDEIVLVPIDGLLIEQVLLNLISNAVKYSPDGSAIDISGRKTEVGLEISVADRGIGLDPLEHDRIFDKFYRSRHLRNDAGRGAGLGLAICRGIVTAHGGRIWAEPRPEGGTTVRFVLPIEGSGPSLVDEGFRDLKEGVS
jgi:two-component system sensor histidine kinase KdpD